MQAVAAENHHLHNQLATTKNSLAAAEQQIQQLEAKLAQKISLEAANITIPIVKRFKFNCLEFIVILRHLARVKRIKKRNQPMTLVQLWSPQVIKDKIVTSVLKIP